MKEKKGRRSFLKNVSLTGLTAMVSPDLFLKPPSRNSQAVDDTAPSGKGQKGHSYNGAYSGAHLTRVAFPIGGMGAGMFCLEGTGALSHMSIRHHPEVFNEPGLFAAVWVKGKTAKVIEGPVPDFKKFGQPGSGTGLSGSTGGLPRFSEASFLSRFPFAHISLKDEDLPVEVELLGWSPFIPGDADNSSLPAGALEYRLINKGKEAVEGVFSYNARNFIRAGKGDTSIGKIASGFVLSQEATAEQPHLKADFAVYTDRSETVVDHHWFRGGWWDPLTMAWNTIKAGELKSNEPVEGEAPGASLFVPFSLPPGKDTTIRVLMAWYVPDSDLRIGKDPDTKENNGQACDFSSSPAASPSLYYKPWYSSRFKSVHEVAHYWKGLYDQLHKASRLFTDAFYASTLPEEVSEAVAANLTILKSPTVLRQYDGKLWSWEGCRDNAGCCPGSCTHVWNYAQAIPHLFPELERSLRHTEFCENQNGEGHQGFRASLPIRPFQHDFHAAADGQLGGIMKVHREWRISGDTAWLGEIYPRVQQSIDYCIRTWDPRHRGVVEEPHHNTYDIEFWGPDGMCTSFYLGALKAMSVMGTALQKDVSQYEELYRKGKAYIESELFDGEYFIQKIQWTGLSAPNPVEVKSFRTTYSDEAIAILQTEGPKYQYGRGCLSDGILGVWMARMCGLEDVVDPAKVTSHLKAVHRYNLKKDLSDHANPQRPSYALGKEGGLLLCSWPKGGKLSLPFVYSDEVWTGIEYQVASHLLLSGRVKEGLEIVRLCRNRYDGRVRNPFNEYECGHWYARAMASYGLLQGLTGVRYDAVDKTLYIDSKVGDFTSFISTATGFGTISLRGGRPVLKVSSGTIEIKKYNVSGKEISGAWA